MTSAASRSLWSSPVFHEPRPDNRSRDIFPLPNVNVEALRNRQVCRAVQRRVCKRARIAERVNMAVDALNSLYFGDHLGSRQWVVSDWDGLPLCQRLALQDVQSAVEKLGDPTIASGPGALSTLRAASSSYQDEGAGVGELVPLAFDDLSLPSGGIAGVNLLEALDEPLRGVVENFQDTMLQDSDVWTSISRDSSHLKPYDDPCLNDREVFLRFVKLLFDRGVLSFTSSCRGRVGAFTVAKKPKVVEGVVKTRQRLVLDCRQTNQLFRPSPYTQLGSISSLAEMVLPHGHDLYVSGADIQDCFYAVHIDEKMQQYFCLKSDLNGLEVGAITGDACWGDESCSYSPCFTVLPMGFSWSFYLVQHIHQSAVSRSLGIGEEDMFRDGFPAPDVVKDKIYSMPYCDNIHSISLDKDLCGLGKSRIIRDLSGMGFSIHEEEEASTWFNTLGGVVDGQSGEVRMSNTRAWNVIYSFQHIATHVTSVDTVQRLLGHAMFFSTLNRAGMCPFRRLYDFVEKGGPPRHLTKDEARECLIFAGLVPLLFASIRRDWSDEVFCCDASPDGYGICSRTIDSRDVSRVARWNERWRYRRLDPDQWAPRQRALGRDPLLDIETVVGGSRIDWDDDLLVENSSFPEIPPKHVLPEDWTTVLMGKWQHTKEHITIKEGRALVLCLRRLCRCSHSRHKRHLILVDNLALAMAVSKGRAKKFSMLRIMQQVGALSLVGSFSCRLRWLPSELNVADGPSRGQVSPGPFGIFNQQTCCSSRNESAHVKSQVFDEEINRQGASSQEGCGSGEEAVNEGSDKWWLSPEGANSSSSYCDKGPRAGREGSWEQGTAEEVDCARDAFNLSGGAIPVPGVLPEVREFLSGAKAGMATSKAVRRHSCRFLGRDVLGRQNGSRGREGGRLSGVHEHRPKGQAFEKQAGSSRVAKRKSTWESSSTSEVAGSRDGYEDGSKRKGAGCTEVMCRPRHLHTSWRVHRLEGKRRGASRQEGGASVPILHADHQRPGGQESRQSGDLRQLNPLQFSQSGVPGRVASSTRKRVERSNSSLVPFHNGRVPEVVYPIGGGPRHPRSASLPDSTWRSFGGSKHKRSRLSNSQISGSVADRSVSEALREVGEDSAAPQPFIARQSGVLSMVVEKPGEGAQGTAESQKSLVGYGWQDVFSVKPLPRKFSLELFAGTARVTAALNSLGYKCYPVDCCLFPSHNVLDIQVEHQLIHWIQANRVQFIWLGMPCTSFSRARKWDGLGPGPLRDYDNLWGFGWLSSRDKQKVFQGNELLRFSIRIMSLCERFHIPYAVENPFSSYAWSMPPMLKFIRRFRPFQIRLDFCQFGEAWQKPTQLLGNFWDPSDLQLVCQPEGGVCSASSRPHVRLTGTDTSGTFMTLKAQPYPLKMAEMVAERVSRPIS